MDFPVVELSPLYPEILLLILASGILLLDVLLGDERRFITYVLALLTLLACGALTVFTGEFRTTYAFGGMFVDDVLADALKFVAYISVFVVLVYSRAYLIGRNLFQGEFFVLVLFALLGMMVMISAHHFLVLYLGLEILSLSLYALVALHRDSAVATEAAMKYFVLGALASGMLLYGISMLYGATGALDIETMARTLREGVEAPMVVVLGLVFVVAGLAFKLGAAPFHMWVPDVYQGAPTPVTLFIGTAPKLASFAFAMRLLAEALQPLLADWRDMLMILAILSMLVGNVAAIAQTNIKRMLAYSAIAHMGFMLLGILSGTINGYSSAMFYVLTYVAMGLGSFGIILLLAREGFEAENLEDFKGLNARNPWYAFLMLLFMFSLAGIPPTVGFYAKLSVLEAVVKIGHTWLAVVAVLLSLVGAFYYLRIVKLMYFDAPVDQAPVAPQADVGLLLSANGAAILLLGIFPQPLMALCAHAVLVSL